MVINNNKIENCKQLIKTLIKRNQDPKLALQKGGSGDGRTN